MLDINNGEDNTNKENTILVLDGKITVNDIPMVSPVVSENTEGIEKKEREKRPLAFSFWCLQLGCWVVQALCHCVCVHEPLVLSTAKWMEGERREYFEDLCFFGSGLL